MFIFFFYSFYKYLFLPKFMYIPCFFILPMCSPLHFFISFVSLSFLNAYNIFFTTFYRLCSKLDVSIYSVYFLFIFFKFEHIFTCMYIAEGKRRSIRLTLLVFIAFKMSLSITFSVLWIFLSVSWFLFYVFLHFHHLKHNIFALFCPSFKRLIAHLYYFQLPFFFFFLIAV